MSQDKEKLTFGQPSPKLLRLFRDHYNRPMTAIERKYLALAEAMIEKAEKDNEEDKADAAGVA